MKTNPKHLSALVALLSLGATGADPAADVTIEQSLRVEGAGQWSTMSSSGSSSLKISGERARMDSRLESNAAFPGVAAGGDSTDIVRLDTGVLMSLQPGERSYEVLTLDEIRRRTEQAMAQAAAGNAGAGLPINEQECQWSSPDVGVTRTGAKARIGGVEAEQWKVEVDQVCTVPASGQVCEVGWNLDYWEASRMPGRNEARAFQAGLARALGGEDQLSLARIRHGGMLGMFRQGWKEVMDGLDRVGELQGFPARSVMSLEIGGEQCRTSGGAPIASDEVWARAADAGIDAGGNTAAMHAGYEMDRKIREEAGNSIGGSIAGSALGAATRELASGMFGKFKRGATSAPEPAAPQPAVAADGGRVTVFRIATEITRVDTGPVAASEFEAPASWRRVN